MFLFIVTDALSDVETFSAASLAKQYRVFTPPSTKVRLNVPDACHEQPVELSVVDRQ
jgi:hypothetical protein